MFHVRYLQWSPLLFFIGGGGNKFVDLFENHKSKGKLLCICLHDLKEPFSSTFLGEARPHTPLRITTIDICNMANTTQRKSNEKQMC